MNIYQVVEYFNMPKELRIKFDQVFKDVLGPCTYVIWNQEQEYNFQNRMVFPL